MASSVASSVLIRPFAAEWLGALREFNSRLDAAGVDAGMRLPENAETEMLPCSRLYVAVEGGAVRGGYVLRPQTFCFRGESRRVAHYRLPLSEGIVDKKYATLGPQLLRNALHMEPLLYALGMGGADRPLPRMLRAMGWKLWPVPFYFRVTRPARFLRHIRAARQSRWRAALMDLAAWSGVGWAGISLGQWRRPSGSRSGVKAHPTQDFGTGADEVWDGAAKEYGAVALRDAATLRQLYPASSARFHRVELPPAGWAVVLDTQMRGDPYFGDLRVGTIADCMARPEDAGAVIHAARTWLERRGVDLVISNQAHAAWGKALRDDGFFQGPSNFLCGVSKPLAELVGSIAGTHLNRGDGDGPVHL